MNYTLVNIIPITELSINEYKMLSVAINEAKKSKFISSHRVGAYLQIKG